MKITVYDINKKKIDDIEVSDNVFAAEVNEALIHQVVNAQLAGMRSGTADTKTRKDVNFTTIKPFKQKGTGRARQGSAKAPIHVGGGTVFGPHPRSFKQKVNKKMFKGAVRSAISDRVNSSALYVIDSINLDVKTKSFVNMLKKFNISNCLVIDNENENLILSSRNVYGVKTITPEQVNPYDVIKHENIILTKNALKKVEEIIS